VSIRLTTSSQLALCSVLLALFAWGCHGDGGVIVTCGDQSVGGTEQCDDGNTVPGDGCSSTCQFDGCGDGTVDPPEQCDDGNRQPCDGCSATCTSESGPTCGDGTVNQACGEKCDDGNTTPGDGCSPTCQLEECGDGTVDPGEQCDDGNTVPGDCCSSTCTIERGPYC